MKFLVALLLCFSIATSVAQKFPESTGLINDFEKWFSSNELDSLNKLVNNFEQKTGEKIIVITTKKTFGYDTNVRALASEMATKWGLLSGKNTNGIVLILSKKGGFRDVVPTNDLVELFDDAFCARAMARTAGLELDFDYAKRVINNFIAGWNPYLAMKELKEKHPVPDGNINDFEGLLGDAAKKELAALIAPTLEARGFTFYIITLAKYNVFEDHYDVGNELMNQWNIEESAVVITVSYADKYLNISREDDLIDKITEEEINHILHELIIPPLQKQHYLESLKAGVNGVFKAIDN
jgi:uncharacterized membrane protein YgcG